MGQCGTVHHVVRWNFQFYYKELHSSAYPDFRSSSTITWFLRGHHSMSIPIFNRLSGVTSMRQVKNNYRIACEQYESQKE